MSRIVTLTATAKEYQRVPVFAGPKLDAEGYLNVEGRRFKTVERETRDSNKAKIRVATHELIKKIKDGVQVIEEVPISFELTEATSTSFRHGDVYDLDDPMDELRLGMLRGSEFFQSDSAVPNPGGLARLKIDDPRKEAKRSSIQADSVLEALLALRTMTETDKADLAFFLKQPAHVMDGVQIDGYLKNLARQQPEVLLQALATDKLRYHVLLQRALSAKLLTRSGSQVMHGPNLIGVDEKAAVVYMQQPQQETFLQQLIASLKEKGLAGNSEERTLGKTVEKVQPPTPEPGRDSVPVQQVVQDEGEQGIDEELPV